ncbi:saccharopine dehydrogenase [Wolffia australiana]
MDQQLNDGKYAVRQRREQHLSSSLYLDENPTKEERRNIGTELVSLFLDNFQEEEKMEREDRHGRSYDVVIFGASGFTGKYVVREALKFLGNPPSSPLQTLALAGRNPAKLAAALRWAAAPSPPPPVPIIAADVDDPASLLAVCRQARLVLNCVGPFRLYGDPVVAACVRAGADYLDICGEPEFMERTEAAHHDQAAESGSLVVSACGFDSIPAELGVLFNSAQWDAPSAPNQITAYLSLESEKKIVGNLGTYESAVLGVANAGKLQEFRRSRPKIARPIIPGPRPANESLIERQKSLGFWSLKLPSADAAVVRRTLAALAASPGGLRGCGESEEQAEQRKEFWAGVKPAHFGVKICSRSLLGILPVIFTGISIGLLSGFSLGRSLLLKFPGFFSLGGFSKTGPSEEEVSSASFKMWFVGHGYADGGSPSTKPDMEIVTRVSGPEVGYITTPIVLLQCALIVLGKRERLPRGGVYPPGIVFGHTDLRQRLQENGISFDLISKKTLPG